MNRRLQTAKYLAADFFAASAGWACFYVFRKRNIEEITGPIDYFTDQRFINGILLIPLFWLVLYALTNTYKNVYRKSRLKELSDTLIISLIGVMILFFTLVLDDSVKSYRTYYKSVSALFLYHFLFTASLRFMITSMAAVKIKNRKIGFRTLLIGSDHKALQLFTEMEAQRPSQGNLFVGYVHVDNPRDSVFNGKLKHAGGIENIRDIILLEKAEEVIIAIESNEHQRIGPIINQLQDTGTIIKIIPDITDILAGSVKMTAIFGAPLIEITPDLMPAWQQPIKRLIDMIVSLLVLVILSPLFVITALLVMITSGFPVFYFHERIGRHGKPFNIFKFRSMVKDAERSGPTLSSMNDSRITPFGRFMRRTRLDEIPQFYNVLIGDMSLVGPRPERQFYIDQITRIAPHYHHLLKVKPGITSWGQVKYGYAENVDQMVDRLKYDLMYIENISLALDVKILFYTLLIVIQGRGK